MLDGYIVQVVTRLVTGDLFRREHYGVACPDSDLAIELVMADRSSTADQELSVTSALSGAIVSVLGMQPDEVRYFGCGVLEPIFKVVAAAQIVDTRQRVHQPA